MIPAVPQTNLPPALVVGALYDSFLQAALRQFFSRATFETEPMLSVSSDGRLAIEPTDDPSVMFVAMVRHAVRPPGAAKTAVHAARDKAGEIDRVGAGRAVPRHPQSQGDGRAWRAVPRRHRGSLRRDVRGEDARTRLEPARRAPTGSPPRSKCFAWPRSRATKTARSHGRADPRRRHGPASLHQDGAGRQARVFAGAYRREGVLPPGATDNGRSSWPAVTGSSSTSST